jgi:hypothetical protein
MIAAIILYILSKLCNAFAAFCSALMDKVETKIQFDNSIFHDKNTLYWSKVHSADHNGFVKGTKYRWDA